MIKDHLLSAGQVLLEVACLGLLILGIAAISIGLGG